MPRLPQRIRRETKPPGSGNFDLEAPGSRFTMRPAFAVQVGVEWMDKSEKEPGVARTAIAAEFDDSWLENEPEIGEVRVLDGVRGRGAASWIPIIEWIGPEVAGGLVGLGVSEAARASIRRIRVRIDSARSSGHRVLVSRGLAAMLAMERVFETTDETEVLHVEFAQEPSSLGGRPPSETSYTGLEPWIVSLVNGSRRTRYLLSSVPKETLKAASPFRRELLSLCTVFFRR
jgi:hypothetical protein